MQLLDKKWEWIFSIGKNPHLASMSIFLIVCPIAAKIVYALPGPYNFTFGGNQYTIIELSLPFSWFALYFCALFLWAGNLLCVIFCPELIKKYNSFKDFDNDKRGAPHLRRLLYEGTGSKKDRELLSIMNEYREFTPLSGKEGKTSLEGEVGRVMEVTDIQKQLESKWNCD